MTRLEQILAEVIATHAGEIGTHSDTCYRYHAGCLAWIVKEILEDER